MKSSCNLIFRINWIHKYQFIAIVRVLHAKYNQMLKITNKLVPKQQKETNQIETNRRASNNNDNNEKNEYAT